MRPVGFRNTIRLMKIADIFIIPVVSFLDTPGAYPGVGAEERGQAEAIAKSIQCCMELMAVSYTHLTLPTNREV